MKLGLGTVQLGLPYGIANTIGQPDQNQAFHILETACNAGIDCFDTAGSYGNSEELLGNFFTDHPNIRLKFSTKIKALQPDGRKNAEQQIRNEVETSLAKLGGKIEYLLFHRVSDLITYANIVERVLMPYCQSGQIQKVGASVYSPDEILALLNAFPVSVIQAPVNAFDQRFLAFDIQEKLNKHFVELHTRSVYLQGLLCIEENQIPDSLFHAIPYLQQYHRLCKNFGLSYAQTAFLYVRDIPCIDCFFVGCETISQLNQNIAYMHASPLPNEMCKQIDTLFHTVPQDIINPLLWGGTQ